jgi:hypothetical protein
VFKEWLRVGSKPDPKTHVRLAGPQQGVHEPVRVVETRVATCQLTNEKEENMKAAATKRLAVLVTLVGAIIAFQAIASASTIRTVVTRTQNDTATTTGIFKALTQGGATSVTFSTTVASSLVKLTYNAECGVLGTPQAWVAVTIFVDGIEANPKNNTDFAMCSADNTTTFEWVGAVRQSTIRVAAGTHKVQIRVDLLNGATQWWLGDTSLAIETQP